MAKRNGPARIKKYGLEFKLKEVQLSDQPGVLIKDVASKLLPSQRHQDDNALIERGMRLVIPS